MAVTVIRMQDSVFPLGKKVWDHIPFHAIGYVRKEGDPVIVPDGKIRYKNLTKATQWRSVYKVKTAYQIDRLLFSDKDQAEDYLESIGVKEYLDVLPFLNSL